MLSWHAEWETSHHENAEREGIDGPKVTYGDLTHEIVCLTDTVAT